MSESDQPFNRINLIDDLLEQDRWVEAANLCLKEPIEGLSKQEASGMLWHVAKEFLDAGQYLKASKIIIGRRKFHVDAYLANLVWQAMPKYSELLIIGCSSVGKTFTAGAWMFLDFIRDPENTAIKVLSLTSEHAKKNVFGTIKNYFTTTRFTYEQKVTAERIGGDDERSGIQLTTVPMGTEGKGRLRGFHPLPRQTPHPIFGNSTRIRVLADECEEIPPGIWVDINNLLASKYDADHVKIVGATNPQDITSAFAQNAEPLDGWSSFDLGTSEEWTSKLGWHVIRLDGAKCENVKYERLVHPGMITLEGFNRYLELGETSPQYHTMARGAFPTQGVYRNAIPYEFIEKGKGELLFTGKTINCCAVDLALEGGDSAVLSHGRWGECYGWINYKGEVFKFEEERYCLQVDKVFVLPKCQSVQMALQIKTFCEEAKVSPEWLIVDSTGVGDGPSDLLKNIFGPEVTGLNYATKATDKVLMLESTDKAEDLYDKVVTELFFATRKFLEFDYVKFGQSVDMSQIAKELCGRKFKQNGKLLKIESKADYKARGFSSPDWADSVNMLVHICRMNAENTPAMIAAPAQVRPKYFLKPGEIDKQNWIDMSQD